MELRDYLHKYKLTTILFAGELDLSVGYIRMIKNKKCVPSLKIAKQIELVTGGEVTVKEMRGNHE